MSKTWQGPCEALKATYSCPLAVRLHRRAGEQSIFYSTDRTGTVASVFRLEKRGNDYFRVDIGQSHGGDPMNTFINVALAHTRHDAELFDLIARHIERRTEDALGAIRAMMGRLDSALEDLDHPLTRLALRYV